MSQAAVLDRKDEKVSDQKYAALKLDGQVVQTHEGMSLEFTTEDDTKITVVVTAYVPNDPNHNYDGFARSDVVYNILPAYEVWVKDAHVEEFNGVGYSDYDRKLIFLTPATDMWSSRKIKSPVQYRSHGNSSQLGKPRKIASVRVIEAMTDAETTPIPVV